MRDQAIKTVRNAISHGQCLRMILSQPVAGGDLVKVTLQPVIVRQQPHLQLSLHTATQVRHENLLLPAAANRVRQLMNDVFQQARLSTPDAEITLHRRNDGTWKEKESPRKEAASPPQSDTEAAHNRRKEYIIPENVPCPFLHEIGVMTDTGKVRAPLYHKFRQINRYLEMVNDVISAMPVNRTLEIVDFGCGKSYLTFALHHLLTVVHQRSVHLVGLDRKTEVVQDCAEIAQRLGCEGLEFREGDFSTYQPQGQVDLAVSLHACDTATDIALAQGVAWGCRAIFAVPCCQHELAPRLKPENLDPLTRFGLLHERFASLVTDALRAQLLEICGYATQVLEFIELEHTPKNVLLRAVRRKGASPGQSQRIAEYHRCRQSLGLNSWALEKALSEVLPEEFWEQLPATANPRAGRGIQSQPSAS